LQWVKIGEKVDDFERVLDNSDGHELFTVISSVHHQGVGETLDDWALGLSESLLGVSSGGVGDVDRSSDLNVIGQGDISDLDILVTPLVEELDAANLIGDLADYEPLDQK